MYYLITVFLGIMALIATIVMMLTDREAPLFAAIAMIMWLFCAASISAVEIPYQIENSADPGTIIEGVQVYTGAAPLSYLFTGLGFFSLVYLFALIFQAIAKKYRGVA